MIPPRKPIPKASFEEIIRDGPVGDLQKKQYKGHLNRRRAFRAGIAPGIRNQLVEEHLQRAMKAERLDEAGLWRVLANPHLPEAVRLRETLIQRVRTQLSFKAPSPQSAGEQRSGGRRRTKGANKKRVPNRFVHKAQGQSRKPGSRRSQH